MARARLALVHGYADAGRDLLPPRGNRVSMAKLRSPLVARRRPLDREALRRTHGDRVRPHSLSAPVSSAGLTLAGVRRGAGRPGCPGCDVTGVPTSLPTVLPWRVGVVLPAHAPGLTHPPSDRTYRNNIVENCRPTRQASRPTRQAISPAIIRRHEDHGLSMITEVVTVEPG